MQRICREIRERVGDKMKEVYLGDGLYVSTDGYQLQLIAPDIEGDRVIYMEPEVLVNFLKYLKTIGVKLGEVK